MRGVYIGNGALLNVVKRCLIKVDLEFLVNK